MKFKSKPVMIEAVQYDGENTKEILAFASPHAYYSTAVNKLRLRTRNGEVTAQPTDWIVVNKHEAYPVPHDVMLAKYEKLEVIPDVPAKTD